jgi:hypothetical protein
MAKPVSKRESAVRGNFVICHDTFVNHDEGLRIAKKRWKRHRSKLLRRTANKNIQNDLSST